MHSDSWSGEDLSRDVPVAGEVPLPPITGAMMKATCNAKAGGATGAEGLSVVLLQKLPLVGWDMLARLFEEIEHTHQWPRDLLWIRVALLSKPGAPSPPPPIKTRLISVESVAVRVWSSIRAGQLSEWLRTSVGEGVIGAVRGRNGLVTAAKKDVDRWIHQCDGRPFGEVAFDASKCFDSLDAQVLLRIAMMRGFPKSLALCLGAFFRDAQRFISFRGHVAGPFLTQRGLPQGNALSVCLAVIWAAEWERSIRSIVGNGTLAVAYLDDMSVATSSEQDIRSSIGATLAFLQRWDVVLNPEKSTVMLTPGAIASWQLDFGGLKANSCWDFLGTCLGTHKDKRACQEEIGASH